MSNRPPVAPKLFDKPLQPYGDQVNDPITHYVQLHSQSLAQVDLLYVVCFSPRTTHSLTDVSSK